MSGHYMSFEATASLRHDAETFIANIHKGVAASQSLLVQRVLDAFVNQCVETYFIAPADVAGLSPMSRKILVTAIATIRKTVQMVVGRIVRKLSNREMQPLAQFMDEIMFRDHSNPDGLAFIAFPLDAQLADRFRRMQQASRERQPQALAETVESFQFMAEEAITYFFDEPVAMLRLGPVLGKMARMGIDTTRSVTNTLIRRIFSTLDEQQLMAVLDYFCGLITDEAPVVGDALVQMEWA